MTLEAESIRLANGVRLPYVEQGDSAGIPLLPVHAIADSWRSFERVLTYLPRSIHVYALTQRGHGDADRPQRAIVPRLAEGSAAFMDALDQAAVVVGGSSSGVVVQRLA